MCAHNSANAPEFFIHHVFIDKIWADWQGKSTAHLEAYFTNLPRHILMNRANFHPAEYIDTMYLPHPDIDRRNDDRICVLYQDPVHPVYDEIMNRLDKLRISEIRIIPRRAFRPANSRQLKRLGVGRRERRKARKLLRKVEPKKKVRTRDLQLIIDKFLGFRLDDIPFRFISKDSPSGRSNPMHTRWLAKAVNSTRIPADHFTQE